jgi:hypothetical protein
MMANSIKIATGRLSYVDQLEQSHSDTLGDVSLTNKYFQGDHPEIA